MEVEAEEMFYTGEMKELLWIKSLNEEEHRQLMRDESGARIKKLEELKKSGARFKTSHLIMFMHIKILAFVV